MKKQKKQKAKKKKAGKKRAPIKVVEQEKPRGFFAALKTLLGK